MFLIILILVCFLFYKIRKDNCQVVEDAARQRYEASQKVSKYCGSCGLLIWDKENSQNYCVVCGGWLQDAQEDVKLGCAEPDCWNKSMTMLYDNALELYRQGKIQEVLDYVKKDAEKNDPRALYWVAMCHKHTNEKVYRENLMKTFEMGYSMALYEMGVNYYKGEYVEKNNVLSQKYLEQAAQSNAGGGRGGLADAYRDITYLCKKGEFRWSKTVWSAEEGYAKAAIRGDLYSLKQMYEGYYSLEKRYLEMGKIKEAPPLEVCRLWWAIKAAELGDLEAVKVIHNCCDVQVRKLSEFLQYPEAQKLYEEYIELEEYWSKREVHMRYPDPDVYEGYVAEVNNELEKALDLYRRAAERNNQQAIEAVRRLTGNKKFMLKAGRLKGEDYCSLVNKSRELLDNGEYNLCLIQARKALEIYAHNLYFINMIDIPENDDLNNLIKELQRRKLVNEKVYNAMDFVRRKGNNAVHGVDKADSEVANRVMDALTQIIENR